MTNRREFLQIGASATAWPLVARAAQAAGIERWPGRTGDEDLAALAAHLAPKRP